MRQFEPFPPTPQRRQPLEAHAPNLAIRMLTEALAGRVAA